MRISLATLAAALCLVAATAVAAPTGAPDPAPAAALKKPVPPTVTLPAQPTMKDCADPKKQRALVSSPKRLSKAFETYARESQAYFTALAQYKSNQLLARKLWTKKREQDFMLGVLKDPVLGREMTANFTRLKYMMQFFDGIGIAEARGDTKGACQMAVGAVGAIYDMVGSNARQWKRMLAMYDEEARRLKTKLD